MHEEPFGSLLPFGLHKGFGLAAMCEILGGALSGGYTTRESTLQKTSAIINCMTSVILDPNAFDAPAAQAEAEAFVEWVKASALQGGRRADLRAGRAGRRAPRGAGANGVPIDPTTCSRFAMRRESGMQRMRSRGLPSSCVERFDDGVGQWTQCGSGGEEPPLLKPHIWINVRFLASQLSRAGLFSLGHLENAESSNNSDFSG